MRPQTFSRILLLAALIVGLTGVDSKGTAYAAPAKKKDPLNGTSWTVEKYADGVFPRTKFPVSFSKGTVSTSDGCNRWYGPYTVFEQTLLTTQFRMTKKACPGSHGWTRLQMAPLVGSSTTSFRLTSTGRLIVGSGPFLTLIRSDLWQPPPGPEWERPSDAPVPAGSAWKLESVYTGWQDRPSSNPFVVAQIDNDPEVRLVVESVPGPGLQLTASTLCMVATQLNGVAGRISNAFVVPSGQPDCSVRTTIALDPFRSHGFTASLLVDGRLVVNSVASQSIWMPAEPPASLTTLDGFVWRLAKTNTASEAAPLRLTFTDGIAEIVLCQPSGAATPTQSLRAPYRVSVMGDRPMLRLLGPLTPSGSCPAGSADDTRSREVLDFWSVGVVEILQQDTFTLDLRGRPGTSIVYASTP